MATESGWLHQLGFDDFAFSGVVHAMAGTSCLVAAYMTGPRLDRLQTEEGTYKTIPYHSVPVGSINSHYSVKLNIEVIRCKNTLGMKSKLLLALSSFYSV